MVENYHSQQKSPAKPVFHILIPFYNIDVYEAWKEPFLEFFWIISSTAYVIIRSSQEMPAFESDKDLY